MTDNLYEQIAKIEREIARLPEGGIAKKTIKGKDYYYHRITRDGKRVENYVSFDNVKALMAGIEERKKLEKELKELKRLISKDESTAIRERSFKTIPNSEPLNGVMNLKRFVTVIFLSRRMLSFQFQVDAVAYCGK